MDNSLYNSLTEKSAVPETNAVIYGDYRFSVITPCLIRIEKAESGNFCDEPTQAVLCRDFEKCSFTSEKLGDYIRIVTEKTELLFDMKKNKIAKVTLCDGRIVTDTAKGNLKGTCRTLDNTIGSAKLDGKGGRVILSDGIISKNGVALLDDGGSLVIKQDGNIAPRKKQTDIYCFAYGFDYKKALHDYFCLTGFPSLIPRFALGNWWSRYKAYTQEEYLTLMHRFEKEQIPLTVATIDMDWHPTDVVERYGKDAKDQYTKASPWETLYTAFMPGWSGYSWNRDLFPQPQEFLSELQRMGLKVTMNLHPHSGCRFFEDAYPEFAEFMGIDKESRKQIFFDIPDEKFREGYFRFLHHPHEKDGVDFWWIDWQQSRTTSVPGLDPLWALNHYHTIDNCRDGKRGLILSRFAGAGSHRYPLGFSGDTFQTWQSLDFQPYFTANAANIGYTWWSHDIGGHCFGKRDDELYLRWIQFGVFSPIMRLHSTSNEFMGKEPWKYRSSVRDNATKALRLRHSLVPYIYTINRQTANDGKALCEPMYYGNPKDERAYECRNEYRFGTELIVCPITQKANSVTGLAGTKVYLPKGKYTDIFTGRKYDGNRVLEMFRGEESIPVLAKEGAIIPVDENDRKATPGNPTALGVWVYAGNNSFTLYEDDGVSQKYKDGCFANTTFTVKCEGDSLNFVIEKPVGDISVIPEGRQIRVIFKDICAFSEAALYKDGKKMKDCHTTIEDGVMTLTLRAYNPESRYELRVSGAEKTKNPPAKELLTDLISSLQKNNNAKASRYTDFVLSGKKTRLPDYLQGPVEEILG